MVALREREIFEAYKGMADYIRQHYDSSRGAAIIGIQPNGGDIATQIANMVRGDLPDITSGHVDPRKYLSMSDPKVLTHLEDNLPDMDKKDIFLVDDEMRTGANAYSAFRTLLEAGRPASIRYLVMFQATDAGLPIREMPIQPDFVYRGPKEQSIRGATKPDVI